MSLTYFWLSSRSKWPNCGEKQTQPVVPPTRYLCQVSNWYLKACRKCRENWDGGDEINWFVITHNFVLLPLSFNKFDLTRISLTYASIREILRSMGDDAVSLNAKWKCVPSVYRWKVGPCLVMSWPNGVVQMDDNIGPERIPVSHHISTYEPQM